MKKIFIRIKNGIYNLWKYGIFTILGFLFLSISQAHASATLYSNSNYNYDNAHQLGGGYSPYTSNLFIPTADGRVNQIWVSLKCGWSSGNGYLAGTMDVLDNTGNVLTTSSNTMCNSGGWDWIGYSFPGNASLTHLNSYKIRINPAAGGAWINYGVNTTLPNMNILDTSIPPSISFLYPVDQSSIGGDFTNWQVYFSSGTYGVNANEIQVRYGSNSSTLSNMDIYGLYSSIVGNATSTYIFPKNVMLFNNIYYAQAVLTDISNNVLAQSAIISFDTTGNQTIYNPVPTPSSTYPIYNYSYNATSTSQWAGQTWSCPVNLFGFSTLDICASVQYLFYNSSTLDAMNSFQNLGSILRAKAPFAYFYSVINIYNSSFTGTATNSQSMPALSLNLSDSALPMVITIFSSSTISKYAGSSAVSLFRTLIGYALWLAFAYFIYYEIRNFREKRHQT